MWLSKRLYEALPFYYTAAGLAMLLVSVYLDRWHWPVICAVLGTALLVTGLTILLKRRDYRSSRSRSAFDDPRY